MSLALLWLQLGAMAAIILVASHFLARSADVVAEKTGLGRSFRGRGNAGYCHVASGDGHRH